MYQHLILVYSDYISGRRIAIHKSYGTVDQVKDFSEIYEEIKREFKCVSFGFHYLETMEESWKSVIEYDNFFTDVDPVNVEDFKVIISNGTIITPTDVAKLILSRCECTQLQLQKLVYFFWCKYTKKYDEYIFDEDFEAWPYGPVINSLYQKFKQYKSNPIYVDDKDALKVLSYCRIEKSPDADKIMSTLDDVINEYGCCSASNLVKKAHVENGPWYKVYNNDGAGEGCGEVISKELIRKFVKS